MEQIIGGTGGIGSKVLTSVFKSEIEDNQNSYRVLESGAYLEISNGYDTGNHPGIIIFDEPAQQSIVPKDMDNFIKSTTFLHTNCQVIMAITLNSHELIEIIDNLKPDTYQKINITGKAFQLLP